MLASPPPRPRSEAQRAAARANGARSHGPITAEGKARSSRNAFRHGLCSPAILAPEEDAAAFEALLAQLRADHRPTSASEDLLVQRLAATFWKLARCDRLEAELAACRPRPPAGRVYPDGTPVLLTRSAELASLSAHAGRLDRALHRLLKALAARPAPGTRATEAEPAAEPAPPPIEIRANEPEDGAPGRLFEPEPAAAAAAVAEPGPAPHAPVGETAPAAPDPEARLLAAARADPRLADALFEQLAAQGELAGLRRLLGALGTDLASFLGPPSARAA